MEKWFIKSFKQRKTNFMGFLRKRISPEQIIQRNWSYKIQIFKIAAKAEKENSKTESEEEKQSHYSLHSCCFFKQKRLKNILSFQSQ